IVVRTRVRSASLMGPRHIAPLLILVCSCDRSPSVAVTSAMPPGPTSSAPAAPVSAPAPPPAAPAPPYDLSSDVALRTDVARARFGQRTRVVVEGDAFVLVDADHGSAFDAGRSQVHRAVHALLTRAFPGPPDRAVTVYVFSTHPAYVAFSKQRFGIDPEPHKPGDRPLYGYYQRPSREILMDGTTGWGTLTHEIVHPFIQRWFGGDGADRAAPEWLDEGIASLFEQPIYDPRDGSIHGETDWRYTQLRDAIESPELGPQVHLESLFDMSDDAFDSRRDATAQGLHYGMARFVCQWLDGQGKLWALFDDWRRAAASGDDASGLTSFTRTVGWTPADADAAWLAYVRHLRPGWTGAAAHL
ncbi:MAG TPA: DUF1570 domain-containing protein, partial [Polyangiaceae bacterium]